ncbi:WXG100 family type VII secretion target [Paenibacillus alvei]|uniref:ESAT-6-like protein n=1 Tax=Paenibacillus alvei TaxID=44250 RepID=A0AAP6ZST4_PAEAL|nr:MULTISPECIES: WXG100 family type VII secretion target [Paenibacillus]EJW17916.1 virulence factor EsxA [Paenibacillus alvei DSM 29]MBG9733683.1 type VII secretion protein EsxA [Paenibacillus alvei]MBG9745774.1 type VII secretion protein EsxA [Paenibacillus alvei]MCY7483338.1 WXG100 family type VII secretion target [Paenibacillus alvei]MCY9543835.1 WXG100 family type VII secretion target [Paenibacillus alvei]
MAGRILITPEQVDQVANQFKQGGDQSQQIVASLTQSIQGMEGQWEGMTKQRFFQEFQEASKQMQSFVQTLNTISEELKAIAQKFRTVDEQR